MKKIKVLIVDDSALIRKLLTELLNSDERIEVVGTAGDPYIARNKIKELRPDVLTLDVEMPNMDGLTFLKNLMRLHPLPVIMVSTLTGKNDELTFDALEIGAIDFVTKPKVNVQETIQDYRDELIEKVIVAFNSTLRLKAPSKESLDRTRNISSTNKIFKTTEQIIAIGASTGGTEAIKDILIDLPPDTAGIVISLHIPAGFSRSFAKRMDSLSKLNVSEATDGQHILPGHVYVAPGDRHLKVVRNGAIFMVQLDDGPLVNRHKPSVEVMFDSIAEQVGQNAIGIMLTGMGADGATAMKKMRSNGAYNIAQDEKSSVVWGMPGAAVKADAVDDILSLYDIASHLKGMSKVA